MLVNKKFDRFKQWAGEKMGNEAKTNTSDDFKALEMEMNLRHDGMERLQKSMSVYVQTIGRKSAGEDRDKQLPVGHLGSAMVAHGHDFSPDSEFGRCLLTFGRANEAIARREEGYVATATQTWLESLERSLAQFKEYQAARKKLETRRLAYDTSLAKMQKAKKEDFRVEEELRAQKAKYEESNEDVFRRMEDIQEGEVESIGDLTKFLDEELLFHQNCVDLLQDLKRGWPRVTTSTSLNGHNHNSHNKPGPRARVTSAAHSFYDGSDKVAPAVVEEEIQPRATIPRVSARSDATHRSESPRVSRAVSYQTPLYNNGTTNGRQYAPVDVPVGRLSPDSGDYRTNDNNSSIFASTPLRSISRMDGSHGDYAVRQPSPTESSTSSNGQPQAKKAPPPPPPIRAKKPPPPPPMKRTLTHSAAI